MKRRTDLYQGHETPSKVFGDCNSSGGFGFCQVVIPSHLSNMSLELLRPHLGPKSFTP